MTIDGSHGEGGGQIVRASVSLASITGRPIRIERIRAGRPKPGLARQHLSAVHAAASVCEARVEGDLLGSSTLTFLPQRPVHAGDYTFDVAKEAKGGSAAAATLVLQTVLVPLALAEGRSTVTVHGGTHVVWSPVFDYVAEIWVPMLKRLGLHAEVRLVASGWYPAGQGIIRAAADWLGAD
jgi:RNA 3'-terminal phosphate cyclase (ATP)